MTNVHYSKIVICADDYAISPGVSLGIRELIAKNRISATGCMTASPDWPREADALRKLDGQADIGLHLTLTTFAPLLQVSPLGPSDNPCGLSKLYAYILTGQLQVEDIFREFKAQLGLFKDQFGRGPDFLDGHHHIHQLPLVRDAFARLLSEASSIRPTYARVCGEPFGNIISRGVAVFKSEMLSLTGRRLRRLLHAQNADFNFGFSGVYNFETILCIQNA